MKKYLYSIALLGFVLSPFSAFAVVYGSDLISGLSTPTCTTNGGGDVASNIKDGNLATKYQTNNILPLVCDFDMTTGRIVRAILLSHEDGNTSLGNFTLEGSNDGISYSVISSGLAHLSTTTEFYEFSNSTSYQYFRIQATDNYRAGNPTPDLSSDDYTSIYELTAYECSSDCGEEEEPPTATTTDMSNASTTAVMGTIAFELAIIISLAFVGVSAFIYNSMGKYKPWQK